MISLITFICVPFFSKFPSYFIKRTRALGKNFWGFFPKSKIYNDVIPQLRANNRCQIILKQWFGKQSPPQETRIKTVSTPSWHINLSGIQTHPITIWRSVRVEINPRGKKTAGLWGGIERNLEWAFLAWCDWFFRQGNLDAGAIRTWTVKVELGTPCVGERELLSDKATVRRKVPHVKDTWVKTDRGDILAIGENGWQRQNKRKKDSCEHDH